MSERKIYQLEMKLFSRAELDSLTARHQLEWLSDFEGGAFAPEKCDVYEPLRQPFDRKNLDDPVQWLARPSGEFKFKRSKGIKIEGYIANRRFAPIAMRSGKNQAPVAFVPSVAEPRFLTAWTVWIEMKIKDAMRAKDLLTRFLHGAFKAVQAEPKKAAQASKTKGARSGSKAEKVLELMRRKEGATLAEIAKATDWQSHSIRGFVSGHVTKKLALKVESTKSEAGNEPTGSWVSSHPLERAARKGGLIFHRCDARPPLNSATTSCGLLVRLRTNVNLL